MKQTKYQTIMPDAESVAQLQRDNKLDMIVCASKNPQLFKDAMSYLEADSTYVLRKDVKKGEVRVYLKDGKVDQFSQRYGISLKEAEKALSDYHHQDDKVTDFAYTWKVPLKDAEYALKVLPEHHARTSVFLAKANKVPLKEAVTAYKFSLFDYSAATRLLEIKEDFGEESGRYVRVRNKGKHSLQRDERLDEMFDHPLYESADLETIAANMFPAGTRPTEIFPQLEATR